MSRILIAIYAEDADPRQIAGAIAGESTAITPALDQPTMDKLSRQRGCRPGFQHAANR